MLVAAIALTVAITAPTSAPGQGGMPLGSTTVAGHADSLFSRFLTFLKTQGDSALALNLDRRTVKARVKATDEPVIFVFDSRGDSTMVKAQGMKGGMAALIFGLGVVHDWLEAGRAAKPDSGH